MSGVAAAFDKVAATYDAQWSQSGIGRMQRAAVWRHLDPFVRPGIRALDLGCGTGDDAVWLRARGALVDAVDASPQMVSVARVKGVSARVARMEELECPSRAYDLVLSNFGALNCVKELSEFSRTLEGLVRPGGLVAFCLLNTFCAWEAVYYAARGRFTKASRRLRGQSRSGMGVEVFYHSKSQICEALTPVFSLTGDVGIGITIPPSYGPRWSESILSRCAAIDRRLEANPLGRAIADHRLLVFEKSSV